MLIMGTPSCYDETLGVFRTSLGLLNSSFSAAFLLKTNKTRVQFVASMLLFRSHALRRRFPVAAAHLSSSSSNGAAGGRQVADAAVAAPVRAVRNVGIMAHIDAGKTTVTERMLFYGGVSRSIGEVHDGDTVMDFMEQERERGITIQSAVVSLLWDSGNRGGGDSDSDSGHGHGLGGAHLLNIIDTPGHVDFTVEVERAVRVLDGGVAVVDAVAGVQAQTEAVWEQAARYGVPRLVFVNKLDRDGACFDAACESLAERLGILPLPLQLPVYESGGGGGGGNADTLSGVVDLLTMELLQWGGERGDAVARAALPALAQAHAAAESSSGGGGSGGGSSGGGIAYGELYLRACDARDALVAAVAELDDELAEVYLEALEASPAEGGMGEQGVLSAPVLRAALRRIVLAQASAGAAGGNHGATPSTAPTPVPVLCGAALKDVGVQPLLDAIVDLLPSPVDCAPYEAQRLLPAPKVKGSGRRAAAAAAAAGPAWEATECDADPAAPLSALAFKVVHAKQAQNRPLVLMRVYSGTLRAKAQLLNSTATAAAAEAAAAAAVDTSHGGGGKVAKRGGGGGGDGRHAGLVVEKPTRLVMLSANELIDVDEVPAGRIGALLGMKATRTGDTLVEHSGQGGGGGGGGGGAGGGMLVLPSVRSPAAVFTVAVEPDSSAGQAALDAALAALCREDPSLRVARDEQTGQQLVSGMGELHLEVSVRVLTSDFSVIY